MSLLHNFRCFLRYHFLRTFFFKKINRVQIISSCMPILQRITSRGPPDTLCMYVLFLHRVPRFFATRAVKVGLAADPKSWFQNPITLCSLKSDVLDDGLDGFDAEYAKASLLLPVGFRRFIKDDDPYAYDVHPEHLAVTCQCVPLFLVPVLKI